LPKVYLFPVKDLPSKLSKITQVAAFHFARNEPLLIATADQTVVQFIDDLLWKTPPESFLPHIVSDEDCDHLIVITSKKKNLNSARYIFNLSPTPLFFGTNLKIIYELDDMTAPNKHRLSQQRFEDYKAAKYPIESK